jgi:hypothetical protein
MVKMVYVHIFQVDLLESVIAMGFLTCGLLL